MTPEHCSPRRICCRRQEAENKSPEASKEETWVAIFEFLLQEWERCFLSSGCCRRAGKDASDSACGCAVYATSAAIKQVGGALAPPAPEIRISVGIGFISVFPQHLLDVGA